MKRANLHDLPKDANNPKNRHENTECDEENAKSKGDGISPDNKMLIFKILMTTIGHKRRKLWKKLQSSKKNSDSKGGRKTVGKGKIHIRVICRRSQSIKKTQN